MFFKLISLLFEVRIKQLIRLFSGIDFLRLLFLLLLLFVVLVMLFGWSSNRNYIKWWVIMHALFILFIHASRKDKDFIRKVCSVPSFLFFTEYLIFSLPVFILLVISKNWLGFLVIPIIFLVTFGKISLTYFLGKSIHEFSRSKATRQKLPAIRQLVSLNPLLFEWNSGLRQTWLIYGFMYLVILTFSFKGYVSHIGIILISILISGYYFYGESRNFIEVFSDTPRRFLNRKLLLNFKYLTLVYAPIIIISLTAQPKMWYLLMIALVVGFSIQFLTIIFKYGLFRKNANLEQNSPILIICVIGVLLPFIWPLPVIMSIRYYRKALKKLIPYFHD